jgi:hypothetical protein
VFSDRYTLKAWILRSSLVWYISGLACKKTWAKHTGYFESQVERRSKRKNDNCIDLCGELCLPGKGYIKQE